MKMKPYYILVLFLFSLSTNAKNLGIIAPTFPIAEMDMLDWIQARLKHLEQTGEMAKMEDRFKEQVKQSVKRPHPVEGITTTTSPSTFFVDPTLTLKEDITNEKGEVLFKKGLQINPFDATTWPNGSGLPPVQLTKQLAFLDGDDERQIAWAKAYREQNPDVIIKWILTNGEPEKVFKVLNERIYFDQQGNITRKLTIKHIPTLAKQDGKRWKMQEFNVMNY
ncbi:conjugal transfer pilus assembly protein TraW [Aliivibrio fischeri]|uniref:Conjugal transfer pilus assembly protein TraW n=2 Tax=Aliivibrio fischeri TaxID=668 RepID=A0A510USR8_ALIFS|nr:conjugal transfer pilus assembly protein TraW [Aliivibrio fischeri]